MTPRHLRIARKVMLITAALPLLQAQGCATFTSRTFQSFANNASATVFSSGLQLFISILNGTSQFLFQSGGLFGGGFGS